MYKETPEQGCLKELHHIFKSIFLESLMDEVRNSTTVVNLNLKKSFIELCGNTTTIHFKALEIIPETLVNAG